MGGRLCLQTRRELLQQLAPQYRQAASAQKRKMFDEFTRITGYHRKYAMWLLNHTEEGQPSPARPRPRQYEGTVQEALVQVWNAANRIAAKRLMPFLPTLVEALEQHGHLHLSEADRSRLLTMSAATADRLLRAHRRRSFSGLSTTRPGPLLKQQIPIRTFQQWNETQPGFLEADLVAHAGADSKGSFLYTLTLTDIATGWTECLPLLSKCQDVVLDALHQARERFPFPILGLDADNGGEFMNELLLSYCEQEQITFTRGRPTLKNDQCFVEQKNGAIVRQVVGYGRLVGMLAYQQLGEVYRALHLYVNCFQPSMKLQEKHIDGKKVHLVYDQARTPLQRLVRAKVLSDASAQELMQMFRAIDPVLLFDQVKELQQALFFHTKGTLGGSAETEECSLRRFCVERCLSGSQEANAFLSALFSEQREPVHEQSPLASLLDWPRTCHDPFHDVWDLIASWVCTSPERNCGEMFRELQRLFPERFRPAHLRTLQRGVRKVRARLQGACGGQGKGEKMEAGGLHPSISVRPETAGCGSDRPVHVINVSPSQKHVSKQLVPSRCLGEEGIKGMQRTALSGEGLDTTASDQKHLQDDQLSQGFERRTGSSQKGLSRSIEHAIQDYLQAQKKSGRRPKTLEWHQTALRLLQEYLSSECQYVLIHQITEAEIQNWLTFLRERPTARGMYRSTGTVASYARSARAFFRWLVRHRSMRQTPFAQLDMPREEPGLLHLVEPAEWERLLLACRSAGGMVAGVADQTSACNQALLWVLAQTGMRTSEVCELQLSDVDRDHGVMRIRGKGSRARWVPLGEEGRYHLSVYLDRYRLPPGHDLKRMRVGEEPLFLSREGCSLTRNSIALLFGRLRKRAGITRKEVGPVLLRDTFAVRYLQAGGDLRTLRQQLGQEESAAVKRYLDMV
ncbi:tyrosine-type recombinase/integrase [Dictyobacter kobayashii]|uniref:Integrase n=1 Tax=Dictyobacter kobayashii TaxID=2014872 RepID=A0A402ASY5_9CHLR|nr:tyrosine-type recombinase/integrase [Dictyobacter kobayashii]GCE22195.1 hypothetical protein KDK_59950 [Dictyobacter kobayashii]